MTNLLKSWSLFLFPIIRNVWNIRN